MLPTLQSPTSRLRRLRRPLLLASYPEVPRPAPPPPPPAC